MTFTESIQYFLSESLLFKARPVIQSQNESSFSNNNLQTPDSQSMYRLRVENNGRDRVYSLKSPKSPSGKFTKYFL